MSAPLSVTANPATSTTVADSCNCAACCPINCCMPFRGRRVKHHSPPPVRQERAGSDVEIHTETTLKVHSASKPALDPDGTWEIEIDGKKFGLKEAK